jgi:opacity protein-like surface antigen
MRKILLAAVMCVTAMSGSRAADLSDLPILRGPVGLSSTRVNWQGFYAGGQGAFGTSDMNFTGATQSVAQKLLFDTAIENFGGTAEWPVLGKMSVHGAGWGAFAGYNSQWSDVVLGVELNYLHGSFGGTQTDSMSRFFDAGGGYTDNVTYQATASMKISDLATARLRAGYAIGSFLPYLFGGVAFGQADIIRTARIFGDQVNPNAPVGFQDVPFDLSATDAKNSHFIYGYSGGLGVDMMLVSCLFLRAEWQYARFAAPVDTAVNTVHVGLGYKF